METAQFVDEIGKEFGTCLGCRLKRRTGLNNRCETCGIRAIYNFEGNKFGIRCSTHRDIGMINVKDRKCQCGKHRSTFNFEDQTTAICCLECKQLGMIDVKHRKCECGKHQPVFNFEGQSKAICCADCKQLGMIDIKHCKCECGKHIPIFNFEGQSKAICCTDCKQLGMIDVVNRKCQCGKHRPTFNFEDQTTAICCVNCKQLGMIDIKHYKCKCGKHRPTFNFEGQSKAICCMDCKQLGMIDVKNRKCKCGKRQPNFNFKDQTTAICCAECKQLGMIVVTTRRCTTCGMTAKYNLPGLFPTYCTRHKLEGMISRPRKKCEICYTSIAIYGAPRGQAQRCEIHKLSGDLCLTQSLCHNCSTIDILNPEGKCFTYCVPTDHATLSDQRSERKEEFIRKFLAEEFKHYPIIDKWEDRIVPYGCTRYRPDIAYDCGTHIVIIEVDEHQHRSKIYHCGQTLEEQELAEKNRMFQIYKQFQHPHETYPVIFIRYNPDTFKDGTGTYVKIPEQKRQDVLRRWVKHCIEQTTWSNPLQIKYLFYDGYVESDIKLDALDVNLFQYT